MKLFYILLFGWFFSESSVFCSELEYSFDDVIDYVNQKPGVLWKAASSKRFRTVQDLREVLGELDDPWLTRPNRVQTISRDLTNVDLPKEFDARTAWPHCKTIGKIRDQSRCGSCWAFATAGVMSDRTCIHSNGTLQVDLSVRDLISCCKQCGAGCHGGYSRKAWEYWTMNGIVTGGTYEDFYGCQPYPFPACHHEEDGVANTEAVTSHYPPCPPNSYDTPECLRSCAPGYNKTYEDDLYRGKSTYYVAADQKQIMAEILLNGPVQASMSVYDDFATYVSGIYHHVGRFYVGAHAVRIIGWGEQYQVPYWIVANSWNEEWGEKGFFRIRRGNDECAIESSVAAGLPLV